MLTSNPELTTRLWTRSLTGNRALGAAVVEGRLPDDLRGTLYRNGPGQFELFGQPYAHPFEGDGAVTAVRLDATGARAGTHIHDTAGLVAERAAGKQLYGFGVPWLRRISNGLRGRGKNTANTSVMYWRGRLLALMEGAGPTEIDPVTLATLGETDLDGVIVSWFSAHPHRVARRRTTYNFGMEVGRKMRLHCYALPDDAPAVHMTAIDLPFGPMLHDFIATDDHLIFFVSPAKVSVPHALLGLGGFEEMFRWRPELGTEVIVVPIDDPAAVTRFQTDAFWQWHFANAHARGGELTVEYVHYPDFDSFAAIGSGRRDALDEGRYHRATIDLRARTFRTEALGDLACEFPKVSPLVEGAAHRYAWMTLGQLDGIGRLDARTGALETHRLPSDQRATEPIFVPRAQATDESDGHVLSLCYDGTRDETFLAVYDGLRLADGPVARVWLGYAVPITFHGIWVA
jgi:all-trans-8'-apo-beta-carotenal 15,15'-oxygenase